MYVMSSFRNIMYSIHSLIWGSEWRVNEDEKKSTTPTYANVEMDDGVPMTTNPSYGQVERM